MSSLVYLGIAVAISLLGALVIYARNRKPTSLEAGIEGFRRELQALEPEPRERPAPEHPGAPDDRRSGLGA